MKRLLFGLLMMCAASMFVACEDNQVTPDDDPTPTPTPGPDSGVVFELTSDGAMVFDNNGGFGTITYKLENPTETGVVTPYTDCDWIINFTQTEAGSIGFTVKLNRTSNSREGIITVTYADKSFDVIVSQRSNNEIDETVYVPNIRGFYYGQKSGGDYGYYISMTDGDWTYLGRQEQQGVYFEKYDWTWPSCYNYFLYVFTPVADAGECKIPDGVYELDHSSPAFGGPRFNAHSSWFRRTDENGWPIEQYDFSDGQLVVEGDRLELTVTIYDNENKVQIARHLAIYEGDYELVYDAD